MTRKKGSGTFFAARKGASRTLFERFTVLIGHAVSCCFYVLISTFCFFGVTAAVAAADDAFADWPGRIAVRINNPELAALTGLASIRLNLGDLARPDGADLRVLDGKGREQPCLVRSITPSGEIELVFKAHMDPSDEYQVLFGKTDAKAPDYKADWKIGRVISEDALPAGTRNHGLWEWTDKVKLSGSFSHTTPVTGAMTYHGTTRFRDLDFKAGQLLSQYVYLDPDDPPAEIVMRLVFQTSNRSNPWDYGLRRVDCSWGTSDTPVELSASEGPRIRLGDCPKPGKWTKLTVDLAQVIAKAPSRGRRRREAGLLPLHGIEFHTDKGRAFWDLTSFDDVPAEAVPVRIIKTPQPLGFIHYTTRSLRLKGVDKPFHVVKFIPTVPVTEKVRWDFGDGHASNDWAPEHLFSDTDSANVTLELPDRDKQPSISRKLTALDVPIRPVRFAVDLVSAPRVVSAASEVLLNLRIEGTSDRALPAQLITNDLDAQDRILDTHVRNITVMPGIDHPLNVTISRKLSQPDLARLTMDLNLMGRRLAGTELNVYDSAASLDGLRLAGDAFLDRHDKPAVVRYGSVRNSLAGQPVDAISRLLVIGDVPTLRSTFHQRLQQTLQHHPKLNRVTVALRKTDSFPEWSFPWREVLNLHDIPATQRPDVIVLALGDRLLLAGVPANDAVNVIGAVLEQLRRKTKAPVVLLIPMPYEGRQKQARDYAGALKKLALLRNVPVLDFYSRAARRIKENPGRYATLTIENGLQVQHVPDQLLDDLLTALTQKLIALRMN